MFKVFINDGTTKPPQDNIYYIVGKEGVFLKKKMGLIDSTIKVNQVSILENVEEKAKLTVRKIPYRSFSRVINFYKDIYEKFNSEAVVLLYYNPSIRRYKIYTPKQNVTGTSGVYKVEKTFPNYQLIGTIHSHGMMSAFHSSTDDNDEKNFDGLHITIGHINDEELDIACSIIANEKRFKVNPIDYIDGLNEVNEPVLNSVKYKLNGVLYPYNKKWLKRINKYKIEHNIKKPDITIHNDYNFFDPFKSMIDNSDDYTQELLRKYYRTHKIDDEDISNYHPCAGCALFDSAKERFEKDFIEEHNLEDILDDADFGEIDLDSLDEITLEYGMKKKKG